MKTDDIFEAAVGSAGARDADIAAVAAAAWEALDLPASSLKRLRFGDPARALCTSFAVERAAQVSIGLAGLASAEFHAARGGRMQDVEIDAGQACAEFQSEKLLEVNGAPQREFRDPLSRLYRTADGWVRVHANFPHHRDGVLELLAADNDPGAVQSSLMDWRSEDFEEEAAHRGLCVSAMRDFDTWDVHPQGVALREEPLVRLTHLPGAPVPTWSRGDSPLQGLRALDLTRVIAGPVCGRLLAGHGADVLRVIGAHLPTIPALDRDTGRGKRTCALDLRTPAGCGKLRELVCDAHIFIDAYRPGSLADRGFGWPDLAAMRPGIVVGSIAAFGWSGPWAPRRGYDSLVQTACGFNAAEAMAFGQSRPRPLPAQALDHATGHLLLFGIAAALTHQARMGGSWRVQVSLARTALWLRSLGRTVPAEPSAIAPRMTEVRTRNGVVRYVEHAARLQATPMAFDDEDSYETVGPPCWRSSPPLEVAQ